jgi:Ca-activated chloride channel family protein
MKRKGLSSFAVISAVAVSSVGALAFLMGQSPAPKQAAAVEASTADRATPKVPENKAGNTGEDFTIRSDVRLVLLDVSVRDPKGGFVSGLKKDDFTVYEDGKQQTISQFADQDIPVSIGIVMDESGSMRPKRPEAITAALTFIQASNPEDEAFIINFNDKVYHGLPDTVLFTDNTNMLRQALWSTAPEGRTALNDAIFASLHQLDMGRRAKKTLVLISDGGDNCSTHTKKDVERKVNETVATIYTIGIFDSDDPDKNPGLLKWLANVSGGMAYFPQTLDGIVPVCRQIAKDIRTRYTIGYVPPDGPPGQLRHIKVSVNSAERGKLIARTRTQYTYNPNAAGPE